MTATRKDRRRIRRLSRQAQNERRGAVALAIFLIPAGALIFAFAAYCGFADTVTTASPSDLAAAVAWLAALGLGSICLAAFVLVDAWGRR